MNNYIVYLPCF